MEWCDWLKELSYLTWPKLTPKASQQNLADLTGVPETTISHVLLWEEKLWQEKLLRHRVQGVSQKLKCDGMDPLVEDPLYDSTFSVNLVQYLK